MLKRFASKETTMIIYELLKVADGGETSLRRRCEPSEPNLDEMLMRGTHQGFI